MSPANPSLLPVWARPQQEVITASPQDVTVITPPTIVGSEILTIPPHSPVFKVKVEQDEGSPSEDIGALEEAAAAAEERAKAAELKARRASVKAAHELEHLKTVLQASPVLKTKGEAIELFSPTGLPDPPSTPPSPPPLPTASEWVERQLTKSESLEELKVDVQAARERARSLRV